MPESQGNDQSSGRNAEGQAAASGENQGGFFGGESQQGGEGGQPAKEQSKAPEGPNGGEQGTTEGTDIPEGYYRLPGEGSTDEDLSAYRKALGVPDTVDGYSAEFDGADDYKNATGRDYQSPDGLLDLLHQHNAPQALVDALAKWDMEGAIGDAQQAQTKLEQDRKTAMDALKGEYGDEFKRNMALADRALKFFGSDEMAAKAKQFGLLEDADFARAFVQIGQLVGEDTFVGGGNTSGGSNPWEGDGNVTAQMKMIRTDPKKAGSMIKKAGKNPADFGL